MNDRRSMRSFYNDFWDAAMSRSNSWSCADADPDSFQSVQMVRDQRGQQRDELFDGAGIYLPPVVVAALVAVFFGGWALLFFLLQADLTVAVPARYVQHPLRTHPAARRRRPARAVQLHERLELRPTRDEPGVWSIGRHAHHHLDPFCSYTDVRIIEGSRLLPYG
jgi:hypothetical protein